MDLVMRMKYFLDETLEYNVVDETISNCCMVEAESFRLDGMTSNYISISFVSHDHTCQPLRLGTDDFGSV